MTMISDITDALANLDERLKAVEAKLNPPQAPPPGASPEAVPPTA